MDAEIPHGSAEGRPVVEATDELPKSFLVTSEYGQSRVYLTKYNAAILEKRIQEAGGTSSRQKEKQYE